MYFLVRHVFVIWAEIPAEVRKVVNMKVAQFLLLNKFALCENPNFLTFYKFPGGVKISRGSKFFTTPAPLAPASLAPAPLAPIFE